MKVGDDVTGSTPWMLLGATAAAIVAGTVALPAVLLFVVHILPGGDPHAPANAAEVL